MRRGVWLGLMLLALPSLALACPTCKDALADSPEALGFARGVYYTVVIMLGVLFSLAGFFIYKIVRLAQAEPEGSAQSQPRS